VPQVKRNLMGLSLRNTGKEVLPGKGGEGGDATIGVKTAAPP